MMQNDIKKTRKRQEQVRRRRNLLFSTGLVVTGCLVSALYVKNMTKNSQDYIVDLSGIESEKDTDGTTAQKEDLAETSGQDILNPDIKKTVGSTTGELTAETQKNRFNETVEETSQDNVQEDVLATDALAENTGLESSPAFLPENGMSWPVIGNVILNYSMDQAVFFQTLMQYKYNPALIISANPGDNVASCAQGIVEEIGENEEIGQYLVMNLGNGYEATYGQLSDIQVQENDAVARGQVIGCVAAPSKYYSVEGSNVYFEVTLDQEPVDPMTMLQ